MKRLLLGFFLFLPIKVFATGCPIYTHDDNNINEEFKQLCTQLERYQRSDVAQDSTTVGNFTFTESTGTNLKLNGNLIVGGNVTFSGFGFAGRVVQIVSTGTVNNQKTTTSGSFADTGLQQSGFTPVFAGSTVLAFVMQSVTVSGAAGTFCEMRITRNTTDVGPLGDQITFASQSASEQGSIVPFFNVDLSPGTGPFTYKTRFARWAGTGTCIVNTNSGSNTGNGGYMILVEVTNVP